MGAWKIATRSLARRPAFAATVVGLLILGVGANTALFSVVDTVLLKPLPYPDAGQLVSVYEASPAKNQKLSLIAPGRLVDWNRLNRTFTAIAGSYSENVTDTSGAEPVRLSGRRVSPGYFQVFETTPMLGRTFLPEEENVGGRLAAVVSYGLWVRGKTVGQRLVIGGQGFTIVGVMPKTFGALEIDLWLPAQTPAFLLQTRNARFFGGVGRMRPGVTVAQAREDLARVQQALGEQFPKTDRGWSATVQDLKEARVGDSRRAVLLLFGAVGLLLMITVTNVASLFLAELGQRERELAIRTSIGASRRQVIGGVMRETAIIAVLGALGGWGAAVVSMKLLMRVFTDVPRMNELQVDWRALLFAMGVSAVGAMSFGLLPALRATSTKHAGDLFRAGRGVTHGKQRIQRAMVASQIAVTMLLLASAGLLLRSFYNLSHVETGFDSNHTFVFHVGAAWDEDRARVGRLQERLISELQKMPGVEAAGITNFLPASGATLRYQVVLDGAGNTNDDGKMPAGWRSVSPGYLKALRTPLMAGQWCPELRGASNSPAKAMVNRRFVDVYGQGGTVLGRHVKEMQSGQSMEIVGVIGDMKEDALNAPAYPYVYYCVMGGNWPDPEYVVRAAGDPRSAIRQLVHNVDPARAVFGVKSLQDAVDADLERPRSNARMVTLFGVAAMLLAAVGLYGLVTQIVDTRRKEIGVRMALGAEPGRILRSIVGSAGVLAAGGILAGLLLTAAAQRTLQSFLFGMGGVDAWSLMAPACLLGAVSVMAALLPARRAASIDPIESIRTE
jgi:putative ABC transport system permease protein